LLRGNGIDGGRTGLRCAAEHEPKHDEERNHWQPGAHQESSERRLLLIDNRVWDPLPVEPVCDRCVDRRTLGDAAATVGPRARPSARSDRQPSDIWRHRIHIMPKRVEADPGALGVALRSEHVVNRDDEENQERPEQYLLLGAPHLRDAFLYWPDHS